MGRVVTCVALFLAISGCGSGDGGKDPRSVATTYRKALAAGDYKKACTLMTTRAKTGSVATRGKTCEDGFKQLFALMDPRAKDAVSKADVKTVSTTGSQAFVQFADGGTLTLVKAFGRWLIDFGPGNVAGQQPDSSALANARNLVSRVEACYSDARDYRQCQGSGQLPNTGLDIGSGRGQVEVVRAGHSGFEVVSHSQSGQNFTIEKASDGTIQRTCDQAGHGPCHANGTW